MLPSVFSYILFWCGGTELFDLCTGQGACLASYGLVYMSSFVIRLQGGKGDGCFQAVYVCSYMHFVFLRFPTLPLGAREGCVVCLWHSMVICSLISFLFKTEGFTIRIGRKSRSGIINCKFQVLKRYYFVYPKIFKLTPFNRRFAM